MRSSTAGYVKKNLKTEVADGAKKYGVKGQEMHHINKDLGLKQSGVSYQKFAPGHRIGFAHKHTEQEEIYAVIAGGGRMKLDDDIIDLVPLDVVAVPKEVTRAIEAGDEGIEFIVFGSPVTGNDRGEMFPGWWV